MTALFRRPRRRLTLFELINHPVTDIVVMALIVASVFLLVVEESFDVAPTSRIHYASQAITAVFALELILRFLAARKKARFFRRYWGRGYATEAARACLDYGFRILRLKRIVGRVMRENAASVRVLEKIGLEFWKEFDFMEHPGLYFRKDAPAAKLK